MVVFTCQHCGDPVKKPAVEKHYNTRCRFKSPHLTCVDCLKDFGGEDYGYHNQCFTEAQRYSAQGTVFKEPKGQKKQEQYIEIIHNILNSKDLTLSPNQRKLLKVCSNHDNVPRKPKPFNNFLKNVARDVHFKQEDIEMVFNVIENAWKKENDPGNSLDKNKRLKGEETSDLNEVNKISEETLTNTHEEITDNKTKSDFCKTKINKRKTASDAVNTSALEKNVNDGSENFINDKKIKKSKIKKNLQNQNYLNLNDSYGNSRMFTNENIEESKGFQREKKQKHMRNSLCLDDADSEVEDCTNHEIDSMENAAVDDIKENQISKKLLKKQKKYEKYLAELENVNKIETNEKECTEGEEFDHSKKKKKNKIFKENKNEPETVGLAEDINSGKTKCSSSLGANAKKFNKRKLEECICETPEKKLKENPEKGAEPSAGAVFDWGDVITKVLNTRPDKELSLKKLGKKVVNEYQTVKKDHRVYEELLAKFNKKIYKVRGVKILRDRAKLIE